MASVPIHPDQAPSGLTCLPGQTLSRDTAHPCLWKRPRKDTVGGHSPFRLLSSRLASQILAPQPISVASQRLEPLASSGFVALLAPFLDSTLSWVTTGSNRLHQVPLPNIRQTTWPRNSDGRDAREGRRLNGEVQLPPSPERFARWKRRATVAGFPSPRPPRLLGTRHASSGEQEWAGRTPTWPSDVSPSFRSLSRRKPHFGCHIEIQRRLGSLHNVRPLDHATE